MSLSTGVHSMAKRKTYTREFKLEAAKLVTEYGYSHKKAAENLGVSGKSIRNWIQQFQQQGVISTEGPGKAVAEQIKLLQAEVKRLRMERDILKKATAYFAKESA
jgi:transposase